MNQDKLKTINGVLTYESICGDRLENTAAIGVSLAKKHNSNISLPFNDINLIATPTSTAESILKEFHDECEKRRAEYEASQEGVAQKERRAKQVLVKQGEIDNLMETLDQVISENSLDKILQWLCEFTTPADDVDVTYDKNILIASLEKAGYKKGHHVGKKPEEFNHKKIMGEYIIGQALSCLYSGIPPHHMLLRFVEDYRHLPNEKINLKKPEEGLNSIG